MTLDFETAFKGREVTMYGMTNLARVLRATTFSPTCLKEKHPNTRAPARTFDFTFKNKVNFFTAYLNPSASVCDTLSQPNDDNRVSRQTLRPHVSAYQVRHCEMLHVLYYGTL